MAASVEDIAGAISRRIAFNFGKLFPEGFPADAQIEGLDDAIHEVAEFHAGCEELGSSDISIMVNEVLKRLR